MTDVWFSLPLPLIGRETFLGGSHQLHDHKPHPERKSLAFSRGVDAIHDDIWTYSLSDGTLTQITETPEKDGIANRIRNH